MNKYCTKCGIEKDVGEFGKAKHHKDGLKSHCKKCHCEDYKTRRLNNPEYRKQYFKKHYQENKIEISQKSKEYYIKNPDKLIYKNNYIKEYYINNPDKLIYRNNKIREWQKNNPDRCKYNLNSYRNNRLRTDINYKLLKCCRDRQYKALKYNRKSAHTRELLGCTVPEFKLYIEKQFQPGMTWDNYGYGPGKWVIDHINPCSSFNMKDTEHQKWCFCFVNQQPLWHEENMAKGDKQMVEI